MTVLVTGGAGGIGSAVCRAFAKNGYNIAIHYHSGEHRAQALADEFKYKDNVKASIFYADVSNNESVREMFDNIEKQFGSLDVLVNNAGIAQQKLFTNITAEDWAKMRGVNLDGTLYCCQEALRRFMLPAHKGAILNISSMWGQVGASCEVHYSAAKAGVIGLTKALAKEVGLSGVRVNCIAPGVIMTDMMAGFDEETLDELRDETPLNRLGTPEDIAEAALFLCSDKASFITGQILGINGGFVI